MVPMDDVHEDHMDECTCFHGYACEVSMWFPWTCMYEVPMDGVREPWMMH